VRSGGPRQDTKDKTQYGLHYGVVVQNKDPDGLSRIKVKLPWLDQGDTDQTHWAQLPSPMEGNKFGWYTLPDIEDAVVVMFVAGDDDAVSFDGAWNGLGMAGNSSIAMELAGVHVTDADRIGAAGAATELVFGVVAPFFLVGLSAVNVGIAAAAAKAATEHAANRRYPDGSSLAEVQFVQHLAHPPVELETWPDENRQSRVVFITRNISEKQVRDLFEAVRGLQ